MNPTDDFAWRAPAPDDWLQRHARLDAALRVGLTAESLDEAGLELRRLADLRLTDRQQLKLEKLSARFVSLGSTPADFRRLRLGVLASRTWEFMSGAIMAAGVARGLLIEIVPAGYDEIDAFAYGEADPFAGQRLDVVLAVLDAAAFPPASCLLDPAAEAGSQKAALEKIDGLNEAIRRKAGCTALFATLSDATVRMAGADLGVVGSRARLIAQINLALSEGCRRGDWMIWDQAELAAWVGHGRWLDPVGRHLAKTPFAMALAPLAADSLCAVLAAIAGKSGRVAVIDLDNTLWGGVVGDDGVEGIRLGQNSAEGEAYLSFQTFLHDLRERGVVLAVCSKNTESVARGPFRSHPDMILRENHIAVFQANWLDKASNIRAIAEALNLGLDAMVFLDDNPAEREQVRQALPLVKTPEIGDDPAWFEYLVRRSGLFEHVALTQEDTARAAAYGAEARRATVRAEVEDYNAYLASLDMTMTISPFDELGLPRVAQLIAKSNQFNLTTRRYNTEDLRRLMTDETVFGWQVRLNDTFGRHGIIAIVIVRIQGREWHIDSWLQSCRVLKRGVEETLMNALVQRARIDGVERIVGEFSPSSRNHLVADFYDRLGFASLPTDTAIKRYTLDPARYPGFEAFIALDGPLSIDASRAEAP